MRSSEGGGDQHYWMGADGNQIWDDGKKVVKRIPTQSVSFYVKIPKILSN